MKSFALAMCMLWGAWWMLTAGGCTSVTDPTTPPTTTPASATQPPYSDRQAEAFASRLPEVSYPTTIEAACKTLGIDLSRISDRLYGHGDLTGHVGQFWTQLSPSYWISFQFNIYDDVGYTNVDIYRPAKRN